MNSDLSIQVSLLAVFDLPTIPTPTTHLIPASLSHVTLQLTGLPRKALVAVLPSVTFRGLDFATWQQARQTAGPNRVRFRFGLVVHFELLSTSPHGNAGTLHYGPENVCPKGTSTLPIKHPHRRTATGSSQCGVQT